MKPLRTPTGKHPLHGIRDRIATIRHSRAVGIVKPVVQPSLPLAISPKHFGAHNQHSQNMRPCDLCSLRWPIAPAPAPVLQGGALPVAHGKPNKVTGYLPVTMRFRREALPLGASGCRIDAMCEPGFSRKARLAFANASDLSRAST